MYDGGWLGLGSVLGGWGILDGVGGCFIKGKQLARPHLETTTMYEYGLAGLGQQQPNGEEVKGPRKRKKATKDDKNGTTCRKFTGATQLD